MDECTTYLILNKELYGSIVHCTSVHRDIIRWKPGTTIYDHFDATRRSRLESPVKKLCSFMIIALLIRGPHHFREYSEA